MTSALLLLSFGVIITILSVLPSELGPAPRPAQIVA
jgi:hypothetical protein